MSRCISVLKQARCEDIEVHILPGALEMPLAAQRLSRSGKAEYDAIICIGAIVKGDTYHFEMIVNECIRGLGQVMLSENVPIIVEVLPVSTIDQLAERSGDDEFNVGSHAGVAAAEIIHWQRRQQE